MAISFVKKSTTHYRADIDGLRGIAILLVFAYHLGSARCRGGFIGVDVFFVISGYLIGSIILSEIAASKFSLLSFYERRIRRIFPALFVVLSASSCFAYRYLLPVESKDFAKSLIASTTSVSNLFFLYQSGYFGAPAAMKPLLHTWSLAVEEQFYVFLPFFLMAIRRGSPTWKRGIVLLVAAVSFLASVLGVFHNPEGTFYLAHTRAWELLLGTLIAMDLVPPLSRPVRNIAACSGLILIFSAGYYFHAAMPFPGAAALMPCIGAALIIAAGRSGSSLVGQALSFVPLVFVGMISYSLYLWHWPILVFQGIGGFVIPGVSPKVAKITVLGFSFVIAALSWRFVEQPFRGRRFALSRATIFRLAAASASILLILGSSALLTNGWPSRFPVEAVKVASFLETADPATEAQYRVGSCFLTGKDRYEQFDPSVCLRQEAHKKNYLLLGDSHAAQLWYGLSSVFPEVNFMQATASGCKPTLEQNLGADEKCLRMMHYIFYDYLPTHSVDTVLVAARWDRRDLERLPRSMAMLKQHGREVVLFGPIVQYDSALPRLLALSIKQNNPEIPADHRIASYDSLDADMARLAATQLGVRYISYYKLLCHQGACQEYAEQGIPLQSDYGHLTGSGSIFLATRIRDLGDLR